MTGVSLIGNDQWKTLTWQGKEAGFQPFVCRPVALAEAVGYSTVFSAPESSEKLLKAINSLLRKTDKHQGLQIVPWSSRDPFQVGPGTSPRSWC